ncbi:hypothetical protein [Actinomadura sp. SCN-SB]|uniref:hypothetical protein n=1 Tax=Actinomadura sp. SCN-SB TaxID=3373092 RepID=UPI00374FF62B
MSLAPDRAAVRERWYAEGWYGTTDLAAELYREPGAGEGTLVFASAGSRVTMPRSQVVATARRVAGLGDAGIGPGDVVAVQAPTSPGAWRSWRPCGCAGASSCPW